MIYKFGEQLVPVTTEEWETDQVPAVFVTDSRHADETLAKAGIIYENEIQVAKIGFCRLENQQDCIVGTKQKFPGNITSYRRITAENDTGIFQKFDPAVDNRTVQFECGDSVSQQASR